MPRLEDDLNPARSTVKGNDTGQLDPATVRRTVDSLVVLSAAADKPMRRKQARAVVLNYASIHGPDLDGWAHWLRNEHGFLDPTGETAIRRVAQGSGS